MGYEALSMEQMKEINQEYADAMMRCFSEAKFESAVSKRAKMIEKLNLDRAAWKWYRYQMRLWFRRAPKARRKKDRYPFCVGPITITQA